MLKISVKKIGHLQESVGAWLRLGTRVTSPQLFDALLNEFEQRGAAWHLTLEAATVRQPDADDQFAALLVHVVVRVVACRQEN